MDAGVDKNQKDSNGRTPLERQICECVSNPTQEAHLRVALFLEFATKEELEALCSKPDMANMLKYIIAVNPKAAINLQKVYPEFLAQKPDQKEGLSETLAKHEQTPEPEQTDPKTTKITPAQNTVQR